MWSKFPSLWSKFSTAWSKLAVVIEVTRLPDFLFSWRHGPHTREIDAKSRSPI